MSTIKVNGTITVTLSGGTATFRMNDLSVQDAIEVLELMTASLNVGATVSMSHEYKGRKSLILSESEGTYTVRGE